MDNGELLQQLLKLDPNLPVKVVLVSATGAESIFKVMKVESADNRIELVIHGN